MEAVPTGGITESDRVAHKGLVIGAIVESVSTLETEAWEILHYGRAQAIYSLARPQSLRWGISSATSVGLPNPRSWMRSVHSGKLPPDTRPLIVRQQVGPGGVVLPTQCRRDATPQPNMAEHA